MLLYWLLTYFTAAPAFAEYRAFELVITDVSNGTERVEISTLDPNQYLAYHPTKYTERVTYRATWMCKGNTAFKQVCAQPERVQPRPPAPAPNPAPTALDQNSAP